MNKEFFKVKKKCESQILKKLKLNKCKNNYLIGGKYFNPISTEEDLINRKAVISFQAIKK